MQIKNIPINQCVHFRGFRYGGFGNNVYEDYILGLRNGVTEDLLRQTFIKRILAFDGREFSSTLNIKLTKTYPSWIYPWEFNSLWNTKIKYFNPADNPDIVCHYSPEGVLASHINREFFWLERAYKTILSGYNPEKFGYINVCCLKHKKQNRYLVLDGNHRLSAMHALGINTVKVNVRFPPLWNIKFSKIWPGVISKKYRHCDAISIFNRYFLATNLLLPEDKKRDIIFDEPLSI